MRTFLGIVAFELRYYLRSASTHVFFAIFLALSFLFVLALGGAFPGVGIGIGGSGGIIHANSPHVVLVAVSALGLFSVLVTAAVTGNSVYRDYESGIHPLFFTSPIGKLQFLGGRFVGSFLVNAYIATSLPLGALLGSLTKWVKPDHLGAFHFSTYAQPYFVVLLPDLLFTGAIFFALAAKTRQMLPNYLTGVMMLVGYLLSGVLLRDIQNEKVAGLLDPFGNRAIGLATKYWTAAEKNTQLLPMTGVIVANRLLWMGIGLAIFAALAWRFRFAHVATERLGRLRRAAEQDQWSSGSLTGRVELPPARRSFSFGTQVLQYLASTRRAFMGIVTNVYFSAIAASGALFLAFSAGQVGKLFGTTTWPVTYQVLGLLGGTFAIFIVIIITFYSGELVWQERELKINQVDDTLPVPGWVAWASRFSALVLVVVVLQCVVLVAGLLTQAFKGYYNFELGLYAKDLFAVHLVDYVLLCVLALLIHALVNQKHVGHVIIVLYYVLGLFMGQLGLEHKLYQYSSDTGMPYSDMNRFGPFVGPFLWFKAYWAAVAVILAVLTNLVWVRGQETDPRWRLQLARLRMGRPFVVVGAVALAAALALGGFIYWNTNVLNHYRTTFQTEEAAARYEKSYKQHEHLPQPRIVAVDVQADIHPKEQRIDFKGSYQLTNKASVPIETIHMRIPEAVESRSLVFDPPAERQSLDEELGYSIWKLSTPLAPGQSMTLAFDLSARAKGFPNDGPGTNVVENGTFVNSGVLPHFGYDANSELDDDDTRKKHGLEPKERMAKVDDPVARRNTYISSDADWVTFKATVSTDLDQTAIAPGYLKREWEENGRRYFAYEMDAPILDFYSFLSARYAVKRDKWNDVAIEIYYHPGHEYDLDQMIDGVKAALEYDSKAFGPYQHRQVRILEFPRYASFAQSFPNTIPYSEAIGFIARVKEDEDDVDYPFYVTAHEVSHQWFAHQVIGANVQGSTLLSESLSQYAALMVMEHRFGPAQMRKFLKYEMDQYLRGRSIERKKEMPLLLVENQQYIHYNKGSVVFYALKDYLGEDRLNGAIKSWMDKVRYQGPPYTNSLELLAALREATPPELQYVLDDMLVNITLYDNRAKSATFTKLPDGKYEVTLTIDAKKLRADDNGNETEVPMDDLIDVGVFAEGTTSTALDKPLLLEKRKIGSGVQEIKLVVDGYPVKAGIDPWDKLIDRHVDDNVTKVETAPAT